MDKFTPFCIRRYRGN